MASTRKRWSRHDTIQRLGIANPGQTIILQSLEPLTTEQINELRTDADLATKRSGVHFVFLNKNIHIAHITEP